MTRIKVSLFSFRFYTVIMTVIIISDIKTFIAPIGELFLRNHVICFFEKNINIRLVNKMFTRLQLI